MKKFLFLFLLLPFSILHSQTDSTYVGKWKFLVDAGEKGTSVSFLLLKADSTFITGADSTFRNSAKKTADGKWKITPEGEIKLVPSDTSREAHYYKHMDGWKFKYSKTEKNGVVSPVQLMEMDIYLEKIIYAKKEKEKKNK